MRIICICGAIITTILVGQDLILENYNYWFDTEKYRPLISSFNTILVVFYFGVFAFYSHKRKFKMVFVLWCIMCLFYIWKYYKLYTFDWETYLYYENYNKMIFIYKVGSAATAILSIGILVSAARKRVALAVFAIISIVIVMISTKDWVSYEGFWYVRMTVICSPLLIALNYILELENYKPETFSPTRKRTEHMALDEIE